MGVRFLSEEWAREITGALNSSDTFRAAAGDHSMKLQQLVADASGDETNYYFTLEGGRAEVSLGEIADPDATLTQSYETAAAIARQELNPQQAFMQGKVKVTGNLMKLMQLQAVFTELPRAVAGVEVDY